jgi:N-hydroxyarylamine O-acetyltransferase
MDHETVVAYLDSVGVTAPAVSDTAGLRTLHRAHQLTVPFENLSIHLAEPISLDEPDLIDKIVRRRRGGFCYELNGAFALLLEALGARVSRVGARVYGEAGLSPPLDHLALIVRPADGTGPWLADVGFGSHSDYPLLLDTRDDQDDPAGRFRLADADEGDIDVLRDGKPQYRLETRERSLADCVPTCWWQQTSPLSHFTQSTICSRLTPDGRVSISGRMLIQTRHGTRTEQQLDTDDTLLAAYRDHFGIALSRAPDDPAATDDRGSLHPLAFPADQLASAVRVEAVDLVDDVHGREGGVVSGGEQVLCRRELAPFRDPEGECVEHDDLGLVIAGQAGLVNDGFEAGIVAV